jgi:hypothetical protein
MISVGLHFGQKRHDRLDYNVDQVFPPGKPFAPGEIYATTMAEIMDHELKGTFGWRPNDIRDLPGVQGSSDQDFLE